jgi:phospholipid transport system transporter-binding protein
MSALLKKNTEGFELKGDLTLATVGNLFANSQLLYQSTANPICLDLHEVNLSDSAGVALLATWVRSIRQQGKQIHLKNIPAQMWATIHVSGLTHILPIEK